MEQALKKQPFYPKVPKSIPEVNPYDANIAKSYLSVAFVSLLIGGLLGLFQGLKRAGVWQLPPWLNYYQMLTAHGVLLLLVFSATFTIGYLLAVLSHTLGGLLPVTRKLAWAGFASMVFGVVLVAGTIVMGEATVLYTFYPPMAAHPLFYIGLIFVVLGVWACCLGVFFTQRAWKKSTS